MSKNYFAILIRSLSCIFLLWVSVANSKAGAAEITSFSTDQCSMFAEEDFVIPKKENLSWYQQNNNSKAVKVDWSQCCVAHDLAYWMGGSENQKALADNELSVCIRSSYRQQAGIDSVYTGHILWAVQQFGGPLVFGSPSTYSFRWGYGWPIGTPFRSLNTEERQQVVSELQKYLELLQLPHENFLREKVIHSIEQNSASNL